MEKALFLRSSVPVNSEYRALLRLWCNAEADEKALRSQVTRFLLALRRDCGQSTYGLKNEDWSDLVVSRRVKLLLNEMQIPPTQHFPGADAAPPTHRLSPRG